MGRPDMWQIFLAGVVLVTLLGVAVIGIGSSSFRSGFNDSAQELLTNSTSIPSTITEADLAGLPEPVQRYLRYTGVVGRETINTVRLEQIGALRQTPEGEWKRIEAVEYFSVNPPAFVWMGEMVAGPLSIVSARDSYVGGRGRMLIKMLGIRTIGDVQGGEMDYSSLVRYLNEMMWFPTAYLNDNVSWEAVDDSSARITISDAGTSASAVLHFDEKGAITNFVGDRYHEVDGAYVKDVWETPITGYGEFNGLRLPVKGEAVWRMSGRDFSYIELELTAVHYNVQTVTK